MNSKIICGPEENFIPPIQSFGKTIYEKLQKADKTLTAFINADNTSEFLTYENVLKFSKNLSNNLRRFGIKTNDVIGIVADNCILYYLSILAGFYIGAPVHLIDCNCTPHELRHLFQISTPKIVFCSTCRLENIKLVQSKFGIEKLIIFDESQDSFENIIRFQDLIEKTDDDFELTNDFDPREHVALLINSSGTTGLPKCAMLTHECLQKAFSLRTCDFFSCSQPVAGICTLPLSHAYGFHICIGNLLTLSKLIIMNKFKTEVFFELIQNFKIKKLFLVPTLINLMVNNTKADKYNLSSLEEICSGGNPLNVNLAKIITKKFNLKNLYQIYGSSECGAIALSQPTMYSLNFIEGKLFPWKLLKISDLETKRPLGVGQLGEICLKGGILKGYLNDKEKTRESIDDEEFFHTGDAGYYDNKGLLYITDRIKDIIKYKSFSFSPVEIEEIILNHPAVEDAAVVGKPDIHAGELPVAFVVKKTGVKIDENECISYTAKYLSEQKQLHGGVRFIEKIPRDNFGKILRKKLKDLL